MEQVAEQITYEVFAWGHGYVGSRESLAAAERLAADFEGARIIIYEDGAFKVVSQLGRYARPAVGAAPRR